MHPTAGYCNEAVKLERPDSEAQHKVVATLQAGPAFMYGLGPSDDNFMRANQMLTCAITTFPVAQNLPGLEAIGQKIAFSERFTTFSSVLVTLLARIITSLPGLDSSMHYISEQQGEPLLRCEELLREHGTSPVAVSLFSMRE